MNRTGKIVSSLAFAVTAGTAVAGMTAPASANVVFNAGDTCPDTGTTLLNLGSGGLSTPDYTITTSGSGLRLACTDGEGISYAQSNRDWNLHLTAPAGSVAGVLQVLFGDAGPFSGSVEIKGDNGSLALIDYNFGEGERETDISFSGFGGNEYTAFISYRQASEAPFIGVSQLFFPPSPNNIPHDITEPGGLGLLASGVGTLALIRRRSSSMMMREAFSRASRAGDKIASALKATMGAVGDIAATVAGKMPRRTQPAQNQGSSFRPV